MNCQTTQEWLLQADEIRPESCAGASIRQHLEECAQCAALARQLRQIEQQWRQLSVSADCDVAKERFLARLAADHRPPGMEPAAANPGAAVANAIPPAESRDTTLVARSRRRSVRWAVAAAVLAASVLVAIALFSSQPAQASAGIVDRLVDLNLTLTQTPELEVRKQTYHEQVEPLKIALRQAELAADERALADWLLETGDWLSEHDDPLDETDRLSQMADKLLERMKSAANRGNARQANRLARQYRQLTQGGLDAGFARLEASSALNFEKQGKLEKLILHDAKRIETVAAYLDKSPNASRKDIRTAVETTMKRQARHGKGKNAAKKSAL